jgi:hypothetical protein
MGKDWWDVPNPEAGFKPVMVGFARLLIKPSVVAYFVLGLTINYWVTFAIYLLLRTCLLGVGNAFIWLALSVAVAAALAGIVCLVKLTIKLVPLGKAAVNRSTA